MRLRALLRQLRTIYNVDGNVLVDLEMKCTGDFGEQSYRAQPEYVEIIDETYMAFRGEKTARVEAIRRKVVIGSEAIRYGK